MMNPNCASNGHHRNLHIMSLHSPFGGWVDLGGAKVSGLGGVGGLGVEGREVSILKINPEWY